MMKIKLEKYQGAKEEDVSQSEKEIGVSFPSDYREFLMRYDGATLEDNAFDGDIHISVDKFVPVAELTKRASSVEGFPKHGILVAECPSGDFIYLDSRRFEVFFWDHEVDSGDKRIASSFGEFLSKLEPFDIDSINLKPGQVISGWVDPNFKPKF